MITPPRRASRLSTSRWRAATGRASTQSASDSAFHLNDPWVTIVGVARDAEQSDWGAAAKNEYFFPSAQNPEDFQRYATFVVRTAARPGRAGAQPSKRPSGRSIPDLPIAEVQTMDQVVSRAVWRPRFSASLLGGFAALALALAAIGIYGVVSYGVNQRAREIGIRMALGARPSDVLRRVLGEGAKLAAAGSAIGVAGSLAAHTLSRNRTLPGEGRRSNGDDAIGGGSRCHSAHRLVAARAPRHARRSGRGATGRVARTHLRGAWRSHTRVRSPRSVS